MTKKILIIISGIVVLVTVGYLLTVKTLSPKAPNQVLSSVVPSATVAPVNTLTTTPMPIIEPINKKVNVKLETTMGNIDLELDGNSAPTTVGNFVSLAKKGFYDGTIFHRVIPNFMIQGGDPLSKDQKNRPMMGTGGPGYEFEDEINPNKLVRGTIAMANSGPDSNGSQFFIVVAPSTPWLDGKHTYFGKVLSGMDIVDKIVSVTKDENDNPVEPIVISKVSVSE